MSNNNKPKWEDAPEWANYLAMDSDGAWFWFEKKPYFRDGLWFSAYKHMVCDIEKRQPLRSFSNCGESLEKRPQQTPA